MREWVRRKNFSSLKKSPPPDHSVPEKTLRAELQSGFPVFLVHSPEELLMMAEVELRENKRPVYMVADTQHRADLRRGIMSMNLDNPAELEPTDEEAMQEGRGQESGGGGGVQGIVGVSFLPPTRLLHQFFGHPPATIRATVAGKEFNGSPKDYYAALGVNLHEWVRKNSPSPLYLTPQMTEQSKGTMITRR